MKPIVIAYYSRTGKTRMVAELLAGLMDADLNEIREVKNRDGARGFLAGCRDAAMGTATRLATRHTLDGRDGLIIGTPVWAGKPAPAIRSYLKMIDPDGTVLMGKKVFAFCTHDGGGGSGTFKTLQKLLAANKAWLIDALELKKPHSDDVEMGAKLTDFAHKIRASLGM